VHMRESLQAGAVLTRNCEMSRRHIKASGRRLFPLASTSSRSRTLIEILPCRVSPPHFLGRPSLLHPPEGIRHLGNPEDPTGRFFQVDKLENSGEIRWRPRLVCAILEATVPRGYCYSIEQYYDIQSPTMSTSITSEVTASISLTAPSSGAMKLDGKATNYGDFRDDLNRDGYAVIKGAVPRERAEAYSNAFYSYIEGL
jgi:hypothetical protein